MGRDTPRIDPMAGYKPLPHQQRFHESKARWRCLSSGFGGGKTVALCREALWTALAYPNSFGLILRKEQRPLTQSTWRTFQQMLNETGLKPPLVKVTGGSDNIPPTVQFSPQVGGSLIKFHNCGNPDNFRGYEPDWIAFDEGSEIPDSIYAILRGRLRGTKNPDGRVEYQHTDPTTGETITTRVSGPLRAWIATNPGPSNWIRQNFRPPGVPGQPSPGFETIACSTHENPYLPPSYIQEMLAEYPEGPRREMFLNGNWGVFEGQVFIEFNPDKHWCDDATAHDLPGWRIIEGWDFGRANETAVVWIAYDENWRHPIRVLDQYAAKERVPSEHAKTVKERRNRLGITELTCVGDPAGAQRGASGSYFEEYARQGIYIAPSTKARSLQIRDERLHQLLATTYPDGTPLIQFCHRAKHLVGDMLALQYKDWNENTNRDRPDERKKKQDHTVDALQYALMILPPPHAIRTASGNRLRDGIGAAAGMINPWE